MAKNKKLIDLIEDAEDCIKLVLLCNIMPSPGYERFIRKSDKWLSEKERICGK